MIEQNTHRKYPRWQIPLGLLGLAILSYGVLIPQLGFYWDELGMMWFRHVLGPNEFPAIWANFRPLLGWLYVPTTSLLGDVPWRWQVFSLVLRWSSAVTLWWLLNELWPSRKFLIIGASSLFLVFPGFTQGSISLIYSHYFLALAVFHLSLMGTLKSLKRRRFWRRWYLFSWASALFIPFTLEYLFGLELIRPLLIWFALGSDLNPRERIGKTLRYWLPFVPILMVYLGWRLFLLENAYYDPSLIQNLLSHPISSVVEIMGTIVSDLFEAGVKVWISALTFPRENVFGTTSTIIYWVIFSLALMLGLRLIWSAVRDSERSGRRSLRKLAHENRANLFLAVLALGVSGWPFWVADLPMRLNFPFDRFLLALMFGSSLLLVSFLSMLPISNPWRAMALSVVIAASVATQFKNANQYRRAWEAQRRFYWQLTWRIPDLAPGTLLLANELPIPFTTDNSLTGSINWMYVDGTQGNELPLMLYDVEKRLGLGLKSLESDVSVYQAYRTMTFEGSTSQVLVFHYVPPGCLRVVDKVLDDSSTAIPQALRPAVHLSRLDLIAINANPKLLPEHIMGPEPVSSWCYFFERADLARQREDWAAIARLGERAFSLADRPNHVEERLPFIEAYGHLGMWDQALDQTWAAFEQADGDTRTLCHTWRRIGNESPYADAWLDVIEAAISMLECQTEL